MFAWNIAKSAEEMFSRWAIKRVCKFLLKKKLGEFIIGDIDLDQLDVQLGAGTIALTDLALNVNYLNEKLGRAPIVVKEGSIGSLLVRFPWKVKNCQIEVEELEIVLGPCPVSSLRSDIDKCMSGEDSKQPATNGLEKLDCEMTHGPAGSGSLDVHEGVKTIAKMVKWLLTSFHVKVKNLIVAFDPSFAKNEDISDSHKTLVIRILETEYGTCFSEDAGIVSDARPDNFLEMTQLTNFIKFHGAIVELLQMNDVDNEQPLASTSGRSSSNSNVECFTADGRTPILMGEYGGFSGTLKLTIPWKNGSLDIRKVDADICIDPMELRLRLSTINWILWLWECLKNVGMDERSNTSCRTAHSVYLSCSSCDHSITLGSAAVAADKMTAGTENFSTTTEKFSSGLCSSTTRETASDGLLPRTNVIPDWVPLSTNKNQKDRAVGEPDYGASIEQFFECFDGMRNSQVALGNSGIWNWTCSVFSAITAASSLADGSVHIPSQQQHVETNLKATITGISVVLSLCDEDQGLSCALNKGCGSLGDFKSVGNASCLTEHLVSSSNDENIHYLEAKCGDLVLALQICPQNMKFEGTIKHVEVDDYFNGNKAVDFGILDRVNDIYSKMCLFQHMQAEVHNAMPPFPFSTSAPCSEERMNVSGSACNHSCKSTNGSMQGICHRSVQMDELVKIKLLQSLSESSSQFGVSSIYSDNMSKASSSFSVKLPPFILWVNFHFVNAMFDFYKKVGSTFETRNSDKSFKPEAFEEKQHDHGGPKRGLCTYVKKLPPQGSLQGNIFLPHARIILCFPFENQGDLRPTSLWDEFIGFDFSSSLSNERAREAFPAPNVNSPKGFSNTPSSIQLNVGDFNVYLITSSCRSGAGNSKGKQTLSAQKIISVTRTSVDQYSGVRMFWQVGPVTGPWIVKKAWSLAGSHVSSRKKMTGDGYEFASVTAVEDLEEKKCCVRQEMMLSSAFVLQIHLASVRVSLGSSEYKLLHRLLNQLTDGFTHVGHSVIAPLDDDISIEQASSSDGNSSQSSVLVECDVIDLSLNLENGEDVKCSMQKELPGSWNNTRLTIEKFELLSVSNLGGISGANFVWVNHGEGDLWGSLTGMNDGFPERAQYLLICCRKSAMSRGDGEGNNALSSGSAGTAIIYLQEPQTSQSFTSVTVRGGTIIAPGGRFDWLNEICSFFSLFSGENEQMDEDSLQKESFQDNAVYEASFFLDLVDVALSYEPHIKHTATNGGVSSEPAVAFLLASASATLSNKSVADAAPTYYKIRVQDLGLLLCGSPESRTDRTNYTVDYLHKSGYVKIAGEALVEAVLTTHCNNDLPWELVLSESHVNIDTCHNTAAGLIRLVAQLQQLFAPDIEESVVHLQTRWNTVQQEHDANDTANAMKIDDSYHDSPSSDKTSCGDIDDKSVVVGLMDEILEDAFSLNGSESGPSDLSKVQSHIPFDVTLPRAGYHLNISNPAACDVLPLNVSFNGSESGSGLENAQTSSSVQDTCFPQVIEGYCISELIPVPKSSVEKNPLNEKDLNCKSKCIVNRDAEGGGGGWYKDNSLKILEDHISSINDQPARNQMHDEGTLPSVNSKELVESCRIRGRVVLKNIDVRWRMYAGSDWLNSSQNGSLTPKVGGRDVTVCLELALSGMNIQYDMFPDGEIYVSKLSLSVQDFHLYDISATAPWKMVLGYYHSKDHPRESCAKAFKLDLEAVRPDPMTPLEEYRLRLAFLPVVLHLDQGQLDFLINFFTSKDLPVDPSSNLSNDMVASSMLQKSSGFGGQIIVEEALLPFFQKCDISPAVVRVDYTPRHVDLGALQEGNYTELLNLVRWKGIELQLKHVHAVGVYGWSSVCETIVGEWLEDISHNQIHKLLKGLAPIRSLFAVGSGAAKLVTLPVKNYRKDRRLIKGMQRGAIAFLRSISLEAVGLGVHLAAGAHDILLQTEYILASNPPSVPLSMRGRTKTSVRSNQPKDAQQGIKQACESLGDGFGKTASALVGNPLKTYQRGAGAVLALASVVKAAPVAAITPASATARALQCALLGVRNSLNPELKKESMEKYLGPPPRDCRK